MTRYADPSLCPDCHVVLPADPTDCPRCRLPLRGPIATNLLTTLATADRLLVELRATAAPLNPLAETPWKPESFPSPTTTHAPPRPAARLSALSVPRILLSLGALCLLVAAVTFLAVAWSWLGVGGRTAVLVALTLVSGGLGSWLGRRGLRMAGEALTVVALGLLALDVVGADDAGWLGQLGDAGLAVAVGSTLLVVALALALVGPGRLITPQVVAPLGLVIAASGALTTIDHPQLVSAAAVLLAAVLAALGRVRGLVVLVWAASTAGGAWWLVLTTSGLADAGDHATWRGLWLDGHGLGLAAAAVLALLPLAARAPGLASVLCSATAAVLASTVVAMPGLDGRPTTVALVCLVALVAWSIVAVLVPRAWLVVPGAPMALAALAVLGVATSLVVVAVEAVLNVGEPFTRSLGVRVADATPDASPLLLVPLVAGLLVATWAVLPIARRPLVVRLAAPVLVIAAIGTLALQQVPLAAVVAALAALGAALLALGVRRSDAPWSTASCAVGGVLGLGAVAAALPSPGLSAGALAVVVLGAVGVLFRGSRPGVLASARMVLPAALAGLLWTVGEIVSVDPALRGAPILLAVGLLALALPRPELEASAGLAGLVAAAAAVDAASRTSTSLALHLTLAGALVTAIALVHPGQRRLAWLGGLLLAAATWVRLADLGVDAPEAYTLPTAVALVLVGFDHLRRQPGSSSFTALAPGLVLATVPSLLWVLAGDPVTARATLLGLGCLALVLAGVRLHWGAPLVVGSVVGGLVVLRELAPYAATTPQWVLIGVAGTLLTVLGVTWESRLRDVQHASAYLARLR